jgi:hypothetical protein
MHLDTDARFLAQDLLCPLQSIDLGPLDIYFDKIRP